jgi:hypothetical protein
VWHRLNSTIGPLWVIFDRSGSFCLPADVCFSFKADLKSDKALGRIRTVRTIWSERFFSKIKQCRLARRVYDKLAANDLALTELASIKLWLPITSPCPWR